MPEISIVIITYNEEKKIAECLKAVQQISSDIVVVDSFSQDNTVNICQQMGAKVIQQKWLGYSAQKNLGNRHAKNDWILSLDADEILSTSFIQNIKNISLENEKTIYQINRLNNYCGQWIKHSGWYPEWRSRLFHKQYVEWNNELVHEDLHIINPKDKKNFYFKQLKGDVLHYSMQSKEEHLEKIEHYAHLQVQKLQSKGKKAHFIKRFLSPLARFIGNYLLKLGFLDGKMGWQIATLSAYETYLKYKKLHKLQQQ